MNPIAGMVLCATLACVNYWLYAYDGKRPSNAVAAIFCGGVSVYFWAMCWVTP